MNRNIIISCSGKFHAFNLAEQLNKKERLLSLYTAYAYQKNKLWRKFARRIDKENIPVENIKTNILIAIGMKLFHAPWLWNELFDLWVSFSLAKPNEARIFIGWSGMSLHTIRRLKKKGCTVILERGSSHILTQQNILKEEYKSIGVDFSINLKVINKELKEYDEADFIMVPSTFVKNSFIENGTLPRKLLMVPYGASTTFFSPDLLKKESEQVFTIIYVGSLLVRKGLSYLFEALSLLDKQQIEYRAIFIGKMDDEINRIAQKYQKNHWDFKGFINHYELSEHIKRADVGVQPSLEEGLSMVIPQILSCGVPVIATTNTGGAELIDDDENGYIVPIRDPEAIASKLISLVKNPAKLHEMKLKSMSYSKLNLSWDRYGDDYFKIIDKLAK